MLKHHTTLSAALVAVALSAVGTQVPAPPFRVEKVDLTGEEAGHYPTAEFGTGRVFVPRGSRVVVVDGPTGKPLGQVPGTPGVREVAVALKWNRGYAANAGDSSIGVFDLKSLTVVGRIPVRGATPQRIAYDPIDDRVLMTSRSRTGGSLTVVDPGAGKVIGSVRLTGAPAGVASDDRARILVADERGGVVHVVDLKGMRVRASWPVAPCRAPAALAFDGRTNRVFVACNRTSVMLDAATGKVVATLAAGDGVDGIAWDADERLLYIPAGATGTVTVARPTPGSLTAVATVRTVPGARTLGYDALTHTAYQFQLEFGRPVAGAARGPLTGAWLVRIVH